MKTIIAILLLLTLSCKEKKDDEIKSRQVTNLIQDTMQVIDHYDITCDTGGYRIVCDTLKTKTPIRDTVKCTGILWWRRCDVPDKTKQRDTVIIFNCRTIYGMVCDTVIVYKDSVVYVGEKKVLPGGIYAWTGNVTSAKIHQWKINGYDGVRIIVPWYTVQPIQVNLTFSNLKSTIKQVSDSGLNIELQIWAGPDAPIFTGYDWLADLGVLTFRTTGGSETGPWANYYDSIYTKAFRTLHSALADTLNNLPQYQKDHVKSVFISSAHTGDNQPYKGAPIGTTYGIENDAKWSAYRRNQWLNASMFYKQNNDFMQISLNTGNGLEDLEWIFTNFPNAYIKHGDRSHEYPLLAETFILKWPDRFYFGEVDDEVKASPYKADHYQLVRSALSTFTDRLDFMDEWDELAHIPDLVNLFHKYYNQYNPITANKGFCALAGKINHLNDVDFPEAVYGEKWTNLKSYTNQYKGIVDGIDPPLRKERRLGSLAYNMRKQDRINNISIATGALFNPEGPYYNHDYSFYVKYNYELNIRQVLPWQTTQYLYRTDLNSFHGRDNGKPKLYEGAIALYFDINDSLFVTELNDNVDITITYKDIGTAIWNIECLGLQKQITNKNTNNWVSVTMNVLDFKSGNKLKYGSDLIIRVVSGESFPFDMIEVVNRNKIR